MTPSCLCGAEWRHEQIDAPPTCAYFIGTNWLALSSDPVTFFSFTVSGLALYLLPPSLRVLRLMFLFRTASVCLAKRC